MSLNGLTIACRVTVLCRYIEHSLFAKGGRGQSKCTILKPIPFLEKKLFAQ